MSARLMLVSGAALFAALSLEAAKTVYVDCKLDDYGGHDGSSPALALKSIDDACVNYAVAGDTVQVASGVYGSLTGTHDNDWGKSRVYLDKKLYLYAPEGPEKTFIEGELAATDTGVGDGAVRCILARGTEGMKSIIEGFTLRGGATAVGSNALGGGSAVCGASNYYSPDYDSGPYVVGCVVSNCTAGSRTGVAWGGTFVRSKLVDNHFKTGIYFAWRTTFVNSILNHNTYESLSSTGYQTAHMDQVKLVNCTCADNLLGLYPTYPGKYFNNLFSASDTTQGGTGGDDGRWVNNFTDSSSIRALIGPANGDCRLRAREDMSDVQIADPTYLGSDYVTLPSDEAPFNIDPYIDIYGMAIPKTGTIAAGASQTTATPQYGAIIFQDTRMSLEKGRPGNSGTYFYSPTYPANYKLYVTFNQCTATNRVLYFYKDYNGTSHRIPPAWNDGDLAGDVIAVIPPASSSETLTVRYGASSFHVWVDRSADPELADGTPEHPYADLQTAADALKAVTTSASGFLLIKPGTYDNSKTQFYFNGSYGWTRLLVPAGTYRFIAVEGPETTIIQGAADSTTANGCGANAINALATGGLATLEGFTIQGCYASFDSGDGGFYSSGRGGAIYTYGTDMEFADCIFKNNVGTYSAVGCGKYFRCRFFNNTGKHVVGDSASVFSCVFCNNTITELCEHIRSVNLIVNCSILGAAKTYAFSSHTEQKRINTVVDCGGYETYANGGGWGCVFNGFSAYQGEEPHPYLVADPLYVDTAANDLRMGSVGKGANYGIRPDDENANNWWVWSSLDVNRKLITFNAEGHSHPGAYAETVDGCCITVTNAGITVTGGKIGFNAMEEGDQITIGTDAAGTRPCYGVTVNGELQKFEDLPNHVYVCTGADANKLIEAVYGSDWYAAVDGSDAASGFIPSEAKSLSGALSNANLKKGDRVLAKAGTYESTEMRQTDGKAIAARAVVPGGVTLESISGRDQTIIRGKAATTMDVATGSIPESVEGLGPDAIRCVYLKSGSKLKGFTLENGHTRYFIENKDGNPSFDHASDETTGGGIGAAGSDRCASWVEDCVIRNCKSYRGGGAMAAKLKNCLLENNYGCYIGGAASDSYAYGCVTRNNTNSRNDYPSMGFSFSYEIVGCTICDGAAFAGIYSKTGKCDNNLFLKSFSATQIDAERVRNCVFNDDWLGGKTDEWKNGTTDCHFEGLDNLVVDDDGRPVIGSNAAIDAGNLDYASVYLSDADQLGGQRIYNNALDIGALEADWRGIYTKDLARRMVTVTAASSNVVEVAATKTVRLLPGASLAASVVARTRSHKFQVATHLVGSGTLTVKRNGEVIGTQTVAGDQNFEFDGPTTDADALTFAFVGENDESYAEIASARYAASGVLLILQ